MKEKQYKKETRFIQHTTSLFYSFDINNESKSYVWSLFTASFPLIHVYVLVILVSLEAFVQSNDTREYREKKKETCLFTIFFSS